MSLSYTPFFIDLLVTLIKVMHMSLSHTPFFIDLLVTLIKVMPMSLSHTPFFIDLLVTLIKVMPMSLSHTPFFIDLLVTLIKVMPMSLSYTPFFIDLLITLIKVMPMSLSHTPFFIDLLVTLIKVMSIVPDSQSPWSKNSILLPFDTRVGGGKGGIQNLVQSVRILHLLQQYAPLLSHIGISHQLYFRMELQGWSFGYETVDKCSLRTGLDPDSRILLNWALV